MDDGRDLVSRSLYTNTTRLTEATFQMLLDALVLWDSWIERNRNNAAVLDLHLRIAQLQVELQVRQGKRPSVGL
jgi:hypothetical protein